ncbi:hypothetical protein B0H10DRAFT_2238504 [Mycena sp. CBHHK59/15]|nr:hypothetical protein B0H10DRAFT_2238504 [Mycena sp. CBHHK59/15]
MPLPELLFSSYCVEVSVNLTLQQHHIPGIGIPGKVLVAQITDSLGSSDPSSNYQCKDLALVVLMIGFIGHGQPLLSLVDWRTVPSEVHAASRSVVLNFADIHPVGTMAHLTGGTDHCSLGVRVALEDQAAFWAFAYLLVKPPVAHATHIATDILSNGGLISQMLDYFKADHGPEYFEGVTQLDSTIQADAMIQPNQTINEAPPPGYSEHKPA